MKDKVILITGGSEGYGKATAKLFSDEGATVVIAARNKEKLAAAKNEINCSDYFAMDVTAASDWDEACSYIKGKFGKIDILVNNAGGGVSIKETTDQSVENIDKIISLNLNSVIYGSRVFGKLMKQQNSGKIINIASVCAKHAWPQWTVYAAAKWGVLGFSKGLYVELQPHNIRVTCVIPAAANTGFQRSSGINEMNVNLRAGDVGRVIVDICKLPPNVVVEEITVWGTDQSVIPL